MTSENNKKKKETFEFYNYCVCFIDLLGQRESMKGQGLMPTFSTEKEKKDFLGLFKESVGSILRLQEDAESMVSISQRQRPDARMLEELSEEQKELWKQSSVTKLCTQRWSDGLVLFTSLGDQEVKCPLNAMYDIFSLSGSLAFMGLATKRPIRGGIDIAWGIELRPGEIYGPAVARAYELESEYAQYPRIAIGKEVINYLNAVIASMEDDIFSNMNRELAKTCLNMLLRDIDGRGLLHYLGQEFHDCVSYEHHEELFNEAYSFITEQLDKFKEENNEKLAMRYSTLLTYFEHHRPSTINT